MLPTIEVFDKNWKKYEEWFEKRREIYLSELKVLEEILPKGHGIEIGVGSGRFAAPLGVNIGIDPSGNILKLAKIRGIKVVKGVGEFLPFKDSKFDFVLIVVTLCFVEDPISILKEAKRVLKEEGEVIIGIIDRVSKWGKYYEAKKRSSPFYQVAKFYSSSETIQMMKSVGLTYLESYQTLYQNPLNFKEIEDPRPGHGEGGFVIILGKKT